MRRNLIVSTSNGTLRTGSAWFGRERQAPLPRTPPVLTPSEPANRLPEDPLAGRVPARRDQPLAGVDLNAQCRHY